jgi:uncharacterized membrane protein
MNMQQKKKFTASIITLAVLATSMMTTILLFAALVPTVVQDVDAKDPKGYKKTPKLETQGGFQTGPTCSVAATGSSCGMQYMCSKCGNKVTCTPIQVCGGAKGKK